MKVGDIIREKDYDKIEWRIPLPENLCKGNVTTYFAGCCKSVNGELISLDGDSYSVDEEVLTHEEWSSPTVTNGLTVVVAEYKRPANK